MVCSTAATANWPENPLLFPLFTAQNRIFILNSLPSSLRALSLDSLLELVHN